MQEGIQTILNRHQLPYQVQRAGSLCCIFFTEKPALCYDDAMTCDTELFKIYFREMLAQGVLLAPSQFEAMFVSVAHTERDLEQTFVAMDKAFAAVKAAQGN